MFWLLEQLGFNTSGFNEWTLDLAGNAGSWLFLLFVVLLGGAITAHVVQLRGRRQSRFRLTSLLVLRLAALGVPALLFLQPQLELLKTVPIRTQVLVGVDQTASMAIADADEGATRAQAVGKLFSRTDPWQEIEENHEVRYFTFAGRGEDYTRREVSREAVGAGIEPSGGATDLAAALEDLARISREKATAGVLLISDGADVAALGDLEGDPGALREFIERNALMPGAPLSTAVVGGESEFPDLAVRELIADEYGFIRNQVGVTVRLASQSIDARQVPVSIRLEGDVVASATATLPHEGGSSTVELSFLPTRVGEFVYTVEVPVLAGEKLTENNRKQFKIKIIRDKVRVLHVVGRPSWDVRFLRRTLKEDPNIDLVSFMILRELVHIPFREQELSLIPFPTDEIFDHKLHTFDLVIFQNFQYMPRYGINVRHLQNIRDFVIRDGGGFVMIGGEQSFGAGNYIATPIEDILPVSLRYSTSLLDEGESVVSGRFSPTLPEGGALHPITRFQFDPGRSSEIWNQLPPLDGMNRTGDLTPGAVALLIHPKLRTPGGRPAPVVAAGSMGKGRSLAIATDSTWYWHFPPVEGGGTNEAYLAFWREAIRWLTRDPALKQLNVSTDRARYRTGEETRISVSVLDPGYKPVKDAEVRVMVRDLSGKGVCTSLANPVGEGQYETTCPVSGNGYLEVQASARKNNQPLGSDIVYIEVVAASREFERTTPNAVLMELLAELGQGSVLQLVKGKLSDEPRIASEKAYRVLGSRRLDLWDTPLALGLVLGLLSTEWWLRRRWGFA